jgi:hypothetical protein
MQDLCLAGVVAARPANTCSQPDSDSVETPAADNFNQSRRERFNRVMNVSPKRRGLHLKDGKDGNDTVRMVVRVVAVLAVL